MDVELAAVSVDPPVVALAPVPEAAVPVVAAVPVAVPVEERVAMLIVVFRLTLIPVPMEAGAVPAEVMVAFELAAAVEAAAVELADEPPAPAPMMAGVVEELDELADPLEDALEDPPEAVAEAAAAAVAETALVMLPVVPPIRVIMPV